MTEPDPLTRRRFLGALIALGVAKALPLPVGLKESVAIEARRWEGVLIHSNDDLSVEALSALAERLKARSITPSGDGWYCAVVPRRHFTCPPPPNKVSVITWSKPNNPTTWDTDDAV